MGLFFHSHVCNDICRNLGLAKFDLAPSEIHTQENFVNSLKTNSTTKSKGLEECLISNSSSCSSIPKFNTDRKEESHHRHFCSSPRSYPTCLHVKLNSESKSTSVKASELLSDDIFTDGNSSGFNKPRSSRVADEKVLLYNSNANTEAFASSALKIDSSNESILGRVHLEICKYHESGRFLADKRSVIDYEAAFFHLRHAANLSVLEAIVNAGKILLQLPHDILAEYKIEVGI